MNPTIHLAMTHEGGDIVLGGTDFLAVLKTAPSGTFLTTEDWITSGGNRKGKLLAAVNHIFTANEYGPGQRVDLAIEELRRLGVRCKWYTSHLLRESYYGELPTGSVAEMAISVGENRDCQ